MGVISLQELEGDVHRSPNRKNLGRKIIPSAFILAFLSPLFHDFFKRKYNSIAKEPYVLINHIRNMLCVVTRSQLVMEKFWVYGTAVLCTLSSISRT